MNNISNLIGSLFNDQNKQKSLLENKQILKVGSILQNIFEHNQNFKQTIDVPRLVVVGSQSSGKSSLLNGILSFDLLPTGSNMVTRTPLHLELIPDNNQHNYVEFGNYKQDRWIVEKKLKFSLPTPLHEEKKAILEEIKNITISIVGNNSNISFRPIHLKIYSKNIPNLTLVDLPGLTMVACTDKGQPKDIKEKIKELVGNYINHKQTIILAVMPARTDMEADIALDLIKQYDPNGKRTIGILTKVDLMNDNTDVINYLQNNVSKDLQLNYGYFAVRNRTPKESKTISIKEAYAIEETYFSSHPTYRKLVDKSHLGIVNMTNKISDILVNKIRESLPQIKKQIDDNLKVVSEQLLELGGCIPDNSEAKLSLLHSIITNFNKQFMITIQNRGVILNTGRNIKDIFINFRKKIINSNPYIQNKNHDYILNAIKNSEGNHMTSPTPPIEVLEQCLRDKTKDPIDLLIKPSQKCCKDIVNELNDLMNHLLKPIKRFPILTKVITNKMNELITKYANITNSKIYDLYNIEYNYIWTDDENFHKNLSTLFINITNKVKIIENMNELLKIYYNTIITNFQNNVPKTIMYFLIKNIEQQLSTTFYESILSLKPNELLVEEGDVHNKRTNYKKQRDKLLIAKKIILENFK